MFPAKIRRIVEFRQGRGSSGLRRKWGRRAGTIYAEERMTRCLLKKLLIGAIV